jgi:A/G-specific adenine glycosylase
LSVAPFARRLLDWFELHGRRHLPWQHPREPYRVWLSEVMLQQTQVATVIPYFLRFIERFPDMRALADAPLDDVLKHWAGLGYYARARNLHRTAQRIATEHAGEFPRTADALGALPGIGRSTAGAILAQAFGQRHAILDGNVRRVLARHAGIDGWPGHPAVQKRLWEVAEAHLPHEALPDYSQAIMDLGSLICTARKPACERCPVREDCVAHRMGRVAELPSAKPRRARPLRKSWLLLVESPDGAFLIQRRGPAGIWGGLWCLPVVDAAGNWNEYVDTLGFHIAGQRQLEPVRHAFTHFELELMPIHLRIESANALNEDAGSRWIKISDRDEWPGLPAPIRKLLTNPLPTPSCPESFTA